MAEPIFSIKKACLTLIAKARQAFASFRFTCCIGVYAFDNISESAFASKFELPIK